MNNLTKRILIIILRISISVALLIFLFRQVDKKGFLEILKTADILLLWLAFLIVIVVYVIALYRWEMLLKGLKVHLSLRRILSSYCGGIFFNLFLPSTIGGDLVRSFDLASHSQKPKEVIASVLLDRLSGYVGMVGVAILAWLIGFNIVKDKTVITIILILAALLGFILAVLFNNFLYSKVNNWLHSPRGNKLRIALKDLHQEIYYFRHHKKIIVNNLLFSLIIQILCPLVFYFTAKALGANTKLLYFFIFIPIISAITMLPISIGGLGLRDATTIFFFAKVGLPKDLSLAMSLINFAFVIIIGFLGGILYVLTLHTRRLQHHKAP